MDLLDYIRALRRRWMFILLFGIAGGIAAATFSLFTPPVYQTSAGILVSAPATSVSDLQAGNQFAVSRSLTYASLASTQAVLKRAVSTLNDGTSVNELAASISTSVQAETSYIVITATATSPSTAARRANAVAVGLSEEAQAADVSRTSARSPVELRLVQAALADTRPIGAGPARNAGLGLAAGLVLGVALSVVAGALDTRLRSPRDVFEVTGRAPVALIPRRPGRKDARAHRPRDEAFLSVPAQLGLSKEANRFIAVAALSDQQVASSVVETLAFTLATSGLRILILDDKSHSHENLAQTERPSRSRSSFVSMVGDREVDPSWQSSLTTNVNISRVSAEISVEHSIRVLRSEYAPPDLRGGVNAYDLVLIDCPPVLTRASAAEIIGLADHCLLVVEAGRDDRGQLARALRVLSVSNHRGASVLLNNVARSDMLVDA